jgi:hypothetical protein
MGEFEEQVGNSDSVELVGVGRRQLALSSGQLVVSFSTASSSREAMAREQENLS